MTRGEAREILIDALVDDAVDLLINASENIEDVMRSGHRGFENYYASELVRAVYDAGLDEGRTEVADACELLDPT